MTNYERIKAMTVEEMADVIEMREFFSTAYNGTFNEKYRPSIEWLQQEIQP